MTKTNDNRGSVWRKWDLHVHTPFSIEQNYGGEQGWNEYITALENLPPEIKVLGINDYIFIEGYTKVIQEKANGRLRNIDLILPVVELRIDKFGNLNQDDPFKRVNFHVIFSPELTPEVIQQQFLSNLASIYKVDAADDFSSFWSGVITRPSLIDLGQKIIDSSGGRITEGPLKTGFNSLNINHDQLMQKLQGNAYLKGKYLTAVGKSEWDTLRWDGSVAEKKNIINRANIVFSASPTVEAAMNAKRKLEEQNVNSNLLHCSDAHGYPKNEPLTIPNDLGHCFTWIKADPTFEGLKQIIFEPEQRVKIQADEPDFKEDKFVIDEVSFVSPNNKFTPQPIHFNKNLNVIIGGKSSGKSILMYFIAKALLADRSILKTDGNYRYNFGEDFDFVVKMKSGLTQSINRPDHEPSILSEIKYIPQNYLSQLAEPATKKGNELLKLVRDLLLEDNDCRIKYDGFVATVKANDRRRELSINTYFELKDKIKTLTADLIAKGNEEALNVNIKTNEDKVTKLKENIGLTPEQIMQYNTLSSELQTLDIQVTAIRSDYSKVTGFNTDAKNIIAELITKKNLALSSIETPELKSHFETEYALLQIVSDKMTEIETLIALDANRKFLINDNVFNNLFQDKARRKAELEKQLQPFLQNQETKKLIENIEKLISEDKQKLSVINQIKAEIAKNKTALEEEKSKIFALYEENFEEYNKIILEIQNRALKLKDDNLEIIGLPKFQFPKFRHSMFGVSDGRRINSNSYDIYDERKNGTSDFDIKTHVASLKQIFKDIDEGAYTLSSKSDTKHAIKLLVDDYFYDYWSVEYDSDTLDKMSTGKASFVILMLIVGLSTSKAPILIDQPEDNLDNRSITKDLVSYLRNKKLERQIIVVTHNPNVVVNADAENIIVANQKGQNDIITSSPYQFDYVNGSLEHSKAYDDNEKDILLSMGIKEHIADIVEGGMEAFKKREKKYGFIEPAVL